MDGDYVSASAVLAEPSWGSQAVGTDTPQVADLIVAYLEQLGVEYVFGIPGGAIEPLYNALARSQRRGGPRPVVARHEAGAAFMADGYARETGKLGVCIATSGPGATNLITGVSCAHDNNVPVLAITGQPVLPSFGKHALQESSSLGVNTLSMFRHCTHYNSLVSHVDQTERKLINAVMAASRSPGGAAHLAIPLDVQRSPAGRCAPTYELSRLLAEKPVLIDVRAVDTLAVDIRRAAGISVLIGSGCGEAVGAIMALVERLQAPFVTTPDAKGLVNPRHPLYRGVFGFGGHLSAEELLSHSVGLVLAFGTGFSELVCGNRCDALLAEILVHIDVADENFARTPMARTHVRGRILSVCERLLELLPPADDPAMRALRTASAETGKPGVSFHAPEAMASEATPIKPQRLMALLSERCPPQTRFVADLGNSMVWTAHYLQLGSRRQRAAELLPGGERRSGRSSWLRLLTEFCPMGWAVGAAVGIARGNPRCPVVCVTGDGAYLMSGQEITVAAMEKLTVVFVVLNDCALGMVKHGQRLAGAEAIGFELPCVDFARLADAFGIPGHVIESPDDFEALDLEAIMSRRGPTMLDVRVDPEEVPPMVLRMKTLGTVK